MAYVTQVGSNNNNNNNIRRDIEVKYDNFRTCIYNIVNKPNEYIDNLRTSSLTEFLAQGALLIKTYGIKTADQFSNCVLQQVNLGDVYNQLPLPQQQVINRYTAYFYEIIMTLI